MPFGKIFKAYKNTTRPQVCQETDCETLAYILVCGLFLSACQGYLQRNLESSSRVPTAVENEATPLTADTFSMQSTCRPEWASVTSEWLEVGGGVKKSLAETRRQIAFDNRSKFAAFVRGVWESQPEDMARRRADFGHWPISEPESRQLTASVRFPESLGIDENCQILDWLSEFFWDEIISIKGHEIQTRKLAETPSNIEWTSPYAQQWIKYWLLVRIEPGEPD